MRAWRAVALGEPGAVLELSQAERKPRGPGEVRLGVQACGLNLPDLLMLRGQYQDPPSIPFIPGVEICGTVLEADDAGTWVKGTRVIASPALPHGGLAEEVCVGIERVYNIPETMSGVEAAALHVTYQTAHLALHRRAGLRAGETVLVHGGAGAVGSAVIQVAAASGASVIATAGGPAKVRAALETGAHHVIDHQCEDIVDRVLSLTDGRGADVIVDPVGGDTFDQSRRCVGWEGRIVVVGFAGGRIAELRTNQPLLRNCSVIGVYFGRYRSMAPEVLAATHVELLALHGRGAIRPLVGSVHRFEEAAEALAALGTRERIGKSVVQVSVD